MLGAILIVLGIFPMPPQSVEYSVLHDARAVHDTVLLQCQKSENADSASCVVADLTPGSRSGSATVDGAYIRVETGTLVVPENAQALIIKEGVWRTIGTAPGLAHGSYSWTEPMRERGAAGRAAPSKRDSVFLAVLPLSRMGGRAMGEGAGGGGPRAGDFESGNVWSGTACRERIDSLPETR